MAFNNIDNILHRATEQATNFFEQQGKAGKDVQSEAQNPLPNIESQQVTQQPDPLTETVFTQLSFNTVPPPMTSALGNNGVSGPVVDLDSNPCSSRATFRCTHKKSSRS